MKRGSEALILGAGFSKAVHEYFPITDLLGQDAVEYAGLSLDARVPRRPFGPGFPFEAWLSLLAEPQPHLSEAENKQNGALFTIMKEAIVSLLSTSQASAFAAGAPKWFYELLSVMHFRGTCAVTLNYDTLVEAGVLSHNLFGTEGRVLPRDILNDLPPLPNTGARFAGPFVETFRLLKLHGSLDWWGVPEDWTGATLCRAECAGAFGAPNQMTDIERRRILPGREPFIVPPSATKSTYYQNPVVKELWRTAFEGLRIGVECP